MGVGVNRYGANAGSMPRRRPVVVRHASDFSSYILILLAALSAISLSAAALAKLIAGSAVRLDGFLGRPVDDPPRPQAVRRVLGSGDALTDLVSGTYEGPSRKTPATLSKSHQIDGSQRSGLTKTAPILSPVSPLSIFFGTAPEPLPPLPNAVQSPKPNGKPVSAPAPVEGYRTVCVRLCDGAYFPISAATTRDRFEHDEETCKKSCTSPSELYVYRVPDGRAETMEDIEGRPYIRLTTAFQFRTAYDSSCTCKPHPWEEASHARHRQYAENARTRAVQRKADVVPASGSLSAALAATVGAPLTPQAEPSRIAAAQAETLSDAMPTLPVTAVAPEMEAAPPPSVEVIPFELPSEVPAAVITSSPKKAVQQSKRRPKQAAVAARPERRAIRHSSAAQDFLANFQR